MPDESVSDGEAKLGYFLIFASVVLGAVALGFLVHDTEVAAWRTAGALLEVLGLSRAALAVDAKLAELTDRPRFAERLRRRLQASGEWLLARLGWKREGRNITLEVDPVEVGISFGDGARASVRPPDDAPPERWIEYLDRELQALRERVQKITQKQRERIDHLSEQLKETRRQLREADREVEDLVERLAIGGFEWELVSLGWFVAGVIAATWGPLLPLP